MSYPTLKATGLVALCLSLGATAALAQQATSNSASRAILVEGSLSAPTLTETPPVAVPVTVETAQPAPLPEAEKTPAVAVAPEADTAPVIAVAPLVTGSVTQTVQPVEVLKPARPVKTVVVVKPAPKHVVATPAYGYGGKAYGASYGRPTEHCPSTARY